MTKVRAMRVKMASLDESPAVPERAAPVPAELRARPAAAVERMPTEEEMRTALTAGVPDLSQVIRKSNDLVRAHYSLSLNATRILAYSLAHIDVGWVAKHQQFPLLRIPLTHIAETFPQLANSNSLWTDMKQATDELFEASVSIPVGKNEKLNFRWAPTCGKVGGSLVVRLNYDLAPYLLDLKERYTAQQLMYVVELRTPYHYRLYEIFRSYLWQGKCALMLDELKAMLEIPVEQYKMVGHFVARVLKPALKALEDVTDIQVAVTRAHKEGKRILGWDFSIRRQLQRKLPLNPRSAPLIERMISLGIKPERAAKFANDYEPKYLEKHIDFIAEKGSSGYIINDPTSFMHRALEENFAFEKLERDEVEKKKAIEETERQLHRDAEERIAQAKRVASPAASEDLRRESAWRLFEGLAVRKQKEVKAAFSDSLTQGRYTSAVISGFAATGFDNPWVRAAFRNFLVEHFGVPEPTRKEIQDYIASHWEAYAAPI